MKVTIYEHAEELPALPAGNYYHSRELMALCERTPRHKPYMVVVTEEDGTVAAHMLGIVRYRGSWLPPYLYSHLRVMGDGEYHIEGIDRQAVFGLMVKAVTARLQWRVLYMEFSHLSAKMFGYRELRRQGYFPVRWMSVHNSLHSHSPDERITERMLNRINRAMERGATTKMVETEDEFRAFSKLLRRHNWLKPRRFIPNDVFFKGMMDDGHCKLFITQVHGHVVGCSACVYSGRDAYLWYSASRRKSFPKYIPQTVTFWNTIHDAWKSGYDHIRFVDVGLPFRKNPYREFILRFGGKEVSTYRWFRISIGWVNRLASWLWRE
jgi:hypothetical protein